MLSPMLRFSFPYSDLNRLFKLLLRLVTENPDQWIKTLSRFMPARSKPSGIYEVLDYKATLELKDKAGKKAVYAKQQTVRFLQNNVIAYQDTAWGDGDIFADYQCTPGVAVDRYREGHRYRTLISLRGTKNKGDIEHFYIQRKILDGFTQKTEGFQTEIDHTTHRLSLRLIFPKSRHPKQVSLMEQNAKRKTVLGTAYHQTLPDGRLQVAWETRQPRTFEAYILHWTW